MPFDPKDRGAGRNRWHNDGTIASDGPGFSGNPWGEIGGFDSTYPFPGFTPPLVTITNPSASHQDVAPATTGTTDDTSQPTTDPGSLEPVQGLLTQANPEFDIIINYDSSITNLQTQNATLYGSITNAISVAVGYYESEIKNAMTVQIDFGWGEEDNGTLSAGAISQSTPGTGNVVANYSSMVAKLEANDPALSGELPASNPESSAEWDVAQTEAIALGLETLNPGQHPLIGYIGLSNTAPFTFDPNNRAVSGDYDAIGALEHEISEVMGRVDILATQNQNGTLLYSAMDLLRFSSPGTHDYTPGPNSYFSLNNGTTDLAALADSTGAGSPDPGDWASSVTADSYDAGAVTGVANTISAVDLSLLHALGYSLAAACYAAGTRVLALRGEVPVEDLMRGEMVYTRFAGLAPIKWIGQCAIDCRRHPDPQQVWPIRIVADAFATGQPHRDLLLSPDHAVAIGDALIPIRVLVNGATIRQETNWPRIHYFHVELDRHDLLIAEGLEAESYLDTGNRGMFENADAALILHPRFNDIGARAGRETLSCLPLNSEPTEVLPTWRALAARAEALGFTLATAATTSDPDLCILANSRRFAPVISDGGLYSFVLPALTDDMRLRSRFTSPAAACPWMHDRRQLGVRVRRISLRTAAGHAEIALDDPRLTDGWWAVERDGSVMRRWTNGDALLPRVDGPAIVELLIGDTLPYPIDAPIIQDARAA